MDYKKLLDQVIEKYFEKSKFDLKGKLEWDPVTEREKTRYFNKMGKDLKTQRRRFKTVQVFWEKPKENKESSGPFLFYHHILISQIENNGVFYCVNDYCWARMGQKIRYKFEIRNPEDNNPKSFKIKLLDEYMMMIR